MIIHVVKQGESISSIAEFYEKSVDRLILENGISEFDTLVVGETLVILYPEIEYSIQEGDTLEGIARSYNTSIMEILRNNPYLSDQQYIYPGESIVIKYRGKRDRRISTNGYIYPFVNLDIFKKTLPFLTYLTVYSYFYTNKGEIFDIDDTDIIQIARSYGVAPIMQLTGYSTNKAEEIEVTHDILNNEDLQDILMNKLIAILRRKKYYGVNFATPYIRPQDRNLYVEFIQKLSIFLRSSGFRIFVSLTTSVFEALFNIKYEELHYDILGQYADKVIVISYEFGYSFGIAPSVIAFDTIYNFYEYMIKKVPAQKLVTGLSTIGYTWRLPYVDQETRGQSMSYDSAIALARECGVEIQYDDVTKASYFIYDSQYEYIVRFRDARGVDAMVSLVPSHNLSGSAIWNVMFFFNQLWLVINSQYEIEKIMPITVSGTVSKR